MFLEMVGDGVSFFGHGHAVHEHTMRPDVLSGHNRGPCRHADYILVVRSLIINAFT